MVNGKREELVKRKLEAVVSRNMCKSQKWVGDKETNFFFSFIS